MLRAVVHASVSECLLTIPRMGESHPTRLGPSALTHPPIPLLFDKEKEVMGAAFRQHEHLASRARFPYLRANRFPFNLCPNMPQLRRELTRFDLTMIAIGSTVGSGIFLTPSIVAHQLPSPLWIGAVWLAGGVMALSGALTMAELGGMLPQAGGVYVFLKETYGGLTGFLYGWAYFLVVNTGGLAALAIAFSTYLGFFIPLSAAGLKIVGISGLVVLTLLNVLGVKIGGIFADLFTTLKLVGIAGLILVAFGWGSFENLRISMASASLPHDVSGAIAVALVGVLWSFGGWQHATYTAAEARRPERDVPMALTIGAVVVTVVYLLANLSYMLLLPVEGIAGSERVAADAVRTILGPIGGSLIAITIFISTFGTAGIYTLTAPRIYFAMSNDGVFFRRIAAVHPKFGTPANAIVLQSVWAILLILFWGTFENLISYVVFTDWIFFALAGFSVIVLRRRRPAAHRPYRTFLYPFTPLLFVGMSVWFVINTFLQKPEQAWSGILFLALGVPVYYAWRRRAGIVNPPEA